MAAKRRTYGLIGDSPVRDGNRRDELNFKATAKVLAGAAVETEDPLTIGIFGGWGTGKTSLMRLIKAKVENHPDWRAKSAAVWFNAWQYEKEDHLIVPLVATINKELEKKEQAEREQEKKTGEKEYVWKRELREASAKVRNALRAIAYGFSIKGKVGIPLLTDAEINLSPKDMFDRYQDITKDSVLSRSLYFDAFEKLEECTRPRGECSAPGPRIVIFVDDLDRCFPDKAVALLEGIKLVLHQPGFSFVLGVNEEIIREFVKTKYQKEFGIDSRYFSDYMDKIVQVKVPVPSREPGDMTQYIGRLLEGRNLFAEEEEASGIAAIAEAGKRNPRSIVRLVNRLVVSSRINKKEGRDECNPTALLIHILAEDARAFREALNIRAGENTESIRISMGEAIADSLKGYREHAEWIEGLEKREVKGPKDSWERLVAYLKKNKHLCLLLRLEIGKRWLSEPEFRRSLARAAESTQGETKKAAAKEALEEEPIEICSVEITPEAGPRLGQTIEFDVSAQTGNRLTIPVPAKDAAYIEGVEVGQRLNNLQFFSHFVMFVGTGIVLAKRKIETGTRKGDWILSIRMENPSTMGM